jgi:hypothetical protein
MTPLTRRLLGLVRRVCLLIASEIQDILKEAPAELTKPDQADTLIR